MEIDEFIERFGKLAEDRDAFVEAYKNEKRERMARENEIAQLRLSGKEVDKEVARLENYVLEVGKQLEIPETGAVDQSYVEKISFSLKDLQKGISGYQQRFNTLAQLNGLPPESTNEEIYQSTIQKLTEYIQLSKEVSGHRQSKEELEKLYQFEANQSWEQIIAKSKQVYKKADFFYSMNQFPTKLYLAWKKRRKVNEYISKVRKNLKEKESKIAELDEASGKLKIQLNQIKSHLGLDDDVPITQVETELCQKLDRLKNTEESVSQQSQWLEELVSIADLPITGAQVDDRDQQIHNALNGYQKLKYDYQRLQRGSYAQGAAPIGITSPVNAQNKISLMRKALAAGVVVTMAAILGSGVTFLYVSPDIKSSLVKTTVPAEVVKPVAKESNPKPKEMKKPSLPLSTSSDGADRLAEIQAQEKNKTPLIAVIKGEVISGQGDAPNVSQQPVLSDVLISTNTLLENKPPLVKIECDNYAHKDKVCFITVDDDNDIKRCDVKSTFSTKNLQEKKSKEKRLDKIVKGRDKKNNYLTPNQICPDDTTCIISSLEATCIDSLGAVGKDRINIVKINGYALTMEFIAPKVCNEGEKFSIPYTLQFEGVNLGHKDMNKAKCSFTGLEGVKQITYNLNAIELTCPSENQEASFSCTYQDEKVKAEFKLEVKKKAKPTSVDGGSASSNQVGKGEIPVSKLLEEVPPDPSRDGGSASSNQGSSGRTPYDELFQDDEKSKSNKSPENPETESPDGGIK